MNPRVTSMSITFFAVALSACAGTSQTTTPHLDAHFGQAVNLAKAQQTLNPDAALNAQPVTGIDGKTAEAVLERYYEGIKQEPAPATVINIGGGLGGN